MNILSYKQLIALFKDIAQRHYQINTYFVGKDSELSESKDLVFPVFQVYPEFARMPQSNGDYKTIIVDFNCKIIDQVNQNEINEIDVHSDCLRIAQDVVNELNQHPYYQRSNASLIGDISFSELEEFEDDFSAGWQFTLSVELINNNSYCGLPFEEITGYSAAGPVSTGYSQSVHYLTCSNLTACTSFQNYVQDAIDSIPSGSTANYYTTGATLIGTTAYFDRNDLLNAYQLELSGLTSGITATGNYLSLSGGTVTGNTVFTQTVDAGTIKSGVIISGSTNLYDIFSSTSANLWSASTGSNSIIANNGTGNIASEAFTIAAGKNNSASGAYSIIIGGIENQASASYSFISNGYKNIASASSSFIGNGRYNKTSGNYSFIGNGYSNSATTNNSSVLGGQNNLASGAHSSVIGGIGNSATATHSFVGGGYKNLASGLVSIAAGYKATASGLVSIAAGYKATAGSDYSVVVGGYKNQTVYSATYGASVGGTYNTVSGQTSAIIGGSQNNSDGQGSFVGGGQYLRASGQHSALIGGRINRATGQRTVVVGGTGITGTTDDSVYMPNAYLAHTTGSKIYSGGTDLYDIFSTGGGSTTGNFLPLSGGTVTGNTNFTVSLTATSISATTIFVTNEKWTIELVDALTAVFYAPYAMQINSITNILNSPSIAIYDDGALYTLTNTIATGSKILVSANTASVVSLNATK
jgi:hypothetical protein